MFYLIGTSDTVAIPSIIPPSAFVPDFTRKLANYLKDIAYIHNVQHTEDTVKFSGSPFRFIWNGWNIFNPVSHGIFTASATGSVLTVEYKIFSIEFLIYSIIFSIIVFSPLFSSLMLKIVYLLIIWSLYIFHIFWVRYRLNKFLKRLAARVVEEYMDSLRKLEEENALG